jgi:tetratricopeptide (TPR) repeat protein
MDAVDLAMRGWAIWNQKSVDTEGKARALFQAALRHDERNVAALNGLAMTYTWEVAEVAFSISDRRAEYIRLAEEAVAKALTLAPESPLAHLTRARLLQFAAPGQALRECELAIDLEPNFARARAFAGLLKVFLGRAEETEAQVSEAIRLSPRDPELSTWYLWIGVADFFLGRLNQAIDRLGKSVEVNPNRGFSYFMLAAALALAGRTAEAAQGCATGRRLAPTFTLAKLRASARGDNPAYLARRETLIEGMLVNSL